MRSLRLAGSEQKRAPKLRLSVAISLLMAHTRQTHGIFLRISSERFPTLCTVMRCAAIFSPDLHDCPRMLRQPAARRWSLEWQHAESCKRLAQHACAGDNTGKRF